MTYIWRPIPEMDLDDGTHTGYASRSTDGIIWLTQLADLTWDVEVKKGDDFVTLVNCKSLVSAKRWVARYL